MEIWLQVHYLARYYDTANLYEFGLRARKYRALRKLPFIARELKTR